MCRLRFKYWPGSVITIISSGLTGFLLLGAFIHSPFTRTSSYTFHFLSLHLPHFTHFGFSSSSERLVCISFTWNSLYPSPQNIIFWQFLCPVLSCLHTAVLFKTASLFISVSASNPRSQTFPTSLFPLMFWPCTACWVVADVKRYWLSAALYCQRSAKLSWAKLSLQEVGQPLGNQQGRHKDNRNINFITVSMYVPIYLHRLAICHWPSEQSKKIRATGNWTQQ